jgi:hypothetical protein
MSFSGNRLIAWLNLNSNDPKKHRTSLEDVGRRVDEEVEKLVSYLNDEVVPSVRSGSSRALRTAAQKLADFAEYLEQNKRGPGGSST